MQAEQRDLPDSLRIGLPGGLAIAMAVVLVAVLLIYILIWSPNFNTAIPGGDYLHFYLAARMFREGNQDRLYDFPFQIQFQHDPARMPFAPVEDAYALYIYPPFFVWFCLPFSYLSFKAGASAWVLFMSGCLIASLHFLLHPSGKSPGSLGFALLAAFPFVPTLMSIYSCQNATLSLLILSSSYAMLRSGKPVAAGFVFALEAFKPQMTLVIAGAMVLKGQWRFVVGAAVGGLLLLVASLAVSPTALGHYLTMGPTLLKWMELPGVSQAEVACWRGFWRLLLGDRLLTGARAAAIASSLLTLLPLVRSLRGPLDTRSATFAPKFAVMVLVTILVSPYLLYYDLTLLLIPMVLAACSRPATGASWTHRRVWPGLTAAVYVATEISRLIAGMIRVQIIVPVIMVYALVLVDSATAREGEPSSGVELGS